MIPHYLEYGLNILYGVGFRGWISLSLDDIVVVSSCTIILEREWPQIKLCSVRHDRRLRRFEAVRHTLWPAQEPLISPEYKLVLMIYLAEVINLHRRLVSNRLFCQSHLIRVFYLNGLTQIQLKIFDGVMNPPVKISQEFLTFVGHSNINRYPWHCQLLRGQLRHRLFPLRPKRLLPVILVRLMLLCLLSDILLGIHFDSWLPIKLSPLVFNIHSLKIIRQLILHVNLILIRHLPTIVDRLIVHVTSSTPRI